MTRNGQQFLFSGVELINHNSLYLINITWRDNYWLGYDKNVLLPYQAFDPSFIILKIHNKMINFGDFSNASSLPRKEKDKHTVAHQIEEEKLLE